MVFVAEQFFLLLTSLVGSLMAGIIDAFVAFVLNPLFQAIGGSIG